MNKKQQPNANATVTRMHYFYACPSCGEHFEPVGWHEHEDGEIILNSDLRSFYCFMRWFECWQQRRQQMVKEAQS
jgi:phage terminase large subunit GpA-like protein